MAKDDSFLSRWSRRKLETEKQPERPQAPAAPAPELPSLDKLTSESDFRAFMDSRVDPGLRRAALKKLFSDPRFNVIDQLDIYIDDYTKSDPIPEEMLKSLEYAKRNLFGGEQNKEIAEAPPAAEPPAPAADDQAPGDPDKKNGA